MKFLSPLSCLVRLLSVGPSFAGGPWYVAPGGLDANDCLSPATPCASINAAIGKSASGDIVNVAVGTYTGSGDEGVRLDKGRIEWGDPAFGERVLLSGAVSE